MVLSFMVTYHSQLDNKISEDAWRRRLRSMFKTEAQVNAMDHHCRKKTPFKNIFPQMLSQFKSSESKTEARNQLAQIVTNFELDPLEVLKGIERYVGIIEDDPTKVLDYAIGEAHRYLCCYSDKSTAEIVKLS